MADEEKAEDAPEGEEPAEEAPEDGAEEGDGEEGEGEEGDEDEEGEEGEGEEGEEEEEEGEVEGEEGIISDESDVFNELMNAGGQAREAAAMIETLKSSVKELLTKEMLSGEDAAVLQAKQDELMARLNEFGALTMRIQTLLQLSHLTESQLCLLEGPRPGEEEEETFDLEIEDETLPKVIICGSEDHIPRIVVCEPTTRKEPPLLKCCCAKHPILGGFGDDTPGYKGDIAMDSLLKQLGSLQQEMKLINEENNFLSKKLSEIVDKTRCSVCNKPKALCRCDKPPGPPPCCVPMPAPPPCSPCCPPVPAPPTCCPPKPKPPCCPPVPTPAPCCPPKPKAPCCPPVPVPPPCCPPKPKPPCCPKPAPPPCCPPKPKPLCNCPLPQKPPCLCCPPCLCSGTPCCCAVPAPPCPPVPCPPDPPLCSCCKQADKKDSSAAISQMENRLRNMITDVSKMQCQLRELQRLRQQLEEEKSDLCPCFDDLF